METTVETPAQVPETGEAGRARWLRLAGRFLPILAALLLSGGLLAAWFTGMAWASTEKPSIQTKPEAVLQQYDFDIVKSSDPLQFIIGQGIDTGNRYRINVRINAAPYPLSVNVRDILPAGVTISNVQAIDWNCSVLATTPQQVSCEYSGTQPPAIGNPYPPIFLNVNVAPSVADTIVNKAELYLDNVQEDIAILTTTIDSVDLSITKKVTPQYADIGDPILYTYVVRNNGPATATGVRIVDSLPVGLVYTPTDITPPPPYFNFTGSSSTIITGTWTLPNLAKGDVITLTLPAAPTSLAIGKRLTNVAKVSSNNLQDRISSNNTASTDFFVSGLEIDKTKPASVTYIAVGTPFTYTITVRNTSTSSASGVVISDVFDPGLSVTGAKLTVGSTVTRFTSGNSLSRSVGTLQAGASAILDVGVRGNATVTQPITVTNLATVRASPSIVRTSNITDTGVVTITPAADFSVLNTDGVTSVTPGQLVTYTVTIQNIGSVITHTNFIVTDTLAAFLDFVSVNLGTLVYTPTFISADNLVHVWQIGEKLDPNEAISYKITGRVRTNATIGQYTDHRVFARSPDEQYLGNNTAVDQNLITVQPVQDYNFVLRIDRTRVNVGEGIHFGITLSNVGSTIPVNAIVTDAFPAVLDIVDAETSMGTRTINASTRTVTVNIGSFSPGQTVLIDISTRVNASATTSAVYDHTSVLTFNPNVEIESNTVEFSVIAAGAGVLPGTGSSPPARRPPSQLVYLVLVAGLLLPMLLLGRRWSAAREP